MLEIEGHSVCAGYQVSSQASRRGRRIIYLLDASVLQVTAGAALRAKRELPLLRKPMRGGGMLNLLGMCCSSSRKRRAHPSKGFDQSFKEGEEYFDGISD